MSTVPRCPIFLTWLSTIQRPKSVFTRSVFSLCITEFRLRFTCGLLRGIVYNKHWHTCQRSVVSLCTHTDSTTIFRRYWIKLTRKESTLQIAWSPFWHQWTSIKERNSRKRRRDFPTLPKTVSLYSQSKTSRNV